jgi:hypothetical protein
MHADWKDLILRLSVWGKLRSSRHVCDLRKDLEVLWSNDGNNQLVMIMLYYQEHNYLIIIAPADYVTLI